MRNIVFHKETNTFHLYNDKISYIMCVLKNGHMGQLYFGKRIHDKVDFSYLVEECQRPMTSYIYEGDRKLFTGAYQAGISGIRDNGLQTSCN